MRAKDETDFMPDGAELSFAVPPHVEAKVAVVTGAGRGIGRALVEALYAKRYCVVPVVRAAEHVAELAAIDRARVSPVQCDVTEPESERLLGEFLTQHFERIDLLVNNAGFGASAYGIEKLDFRELDAVLAVHCYAPIRCTRACLPLLRRSLKGTIANISSRFGSLQWVASRSVPADQATYPYRIAKAAMNMFTSCLAVELAAEKIRVLAVDPGKVKTRFGPSDADLEPVQAAEAILQIVENGWETAVFVNSSTGEKVPW